MGKAKFDEVLSFYPDRVIVFDTETTGLNPDSNEVLSLSIVSADGEVLFDHLIKPQKRKRWPSAQEIHGISPKDVAEEKTLVDYLDELEQYFDGSYLLVGYNIQFDIGMLKASGLDVKRGVKTFDVMTEAEQMNGRRVKLAECARIFGYADFNPHGSLEDSRATAYCFKRLVEDDAYRQIRELEAKGVSKESARLIAAQNHNSGNGASAGAIVFCLFLVVFILLLFGFFACTAVFR